MVTFREFVAAFRKLGVPSDRPVIAHASLSAFGEVHGGADTVLGALLASTGGLLMPTFTYKTMLEPEEGPAGNGMVYGSGHDRNLMAEFFRPEMPADRLMGKVPEALRRHPKARRSSHPILSFAGVNVDRLLEAQTLRDSLAPIRALAEAGGWVVLLGVDHTVNTSIHYGESLAGRKQFVRWALTPLGVIECPGFPGCSDGFQVISGRLKGLSRKVQVGTGRIEALPVTDLAQVVQEMLAEAPLALLCDRSYCERCDAVRKEIPVPGEAAA